MYAQTQLIHSILLASLFRNISYLALSARQHVRLRHTAQHDLSVDSNCDADPTPTIRVNPDTQPSGAHASKQAMTP